MIVYKILHKSHGRLYSYCHGWCDGCLLYKIGKETKGREGEGPLAAFPTLKTAKRYLVKDGGSANEGFSINQYHIFECEYTPYEGATKLWCYHQSGYKEKCILDIPKGTIFCSSVTPLRQMP